MFISLLGLLSFQAYWISSAYNQRKTTLEAEIREAFSKANNGLLVKKLGDFSGVEVSITTDGSFFSTDTKMLKKGAFNLMDRREGKGGTTIIHSSELGDYSIDTIVTEIGAVMQEMSTTLSTSVFANSGDISTTDFEFMDSLLRTYLMPIRFENEYELSFGNTEEGGFEFTSGVHRFNPREEKVKVFMQPISFAEGNKMARLLFPEKQLVKSSLTDISLIILASIVMLALLISAWYYIVRSLQRQYQLTQMKDDFISNMTHELKTPVTASSLALEVLAKNQKVSNDQDLQGLISVAKSEQDRMLNMIDTILEGTSQHQMGEEAMEQLDLVEELEAVTETIQLKATEAGGHLKLDVAAESIYVRGSQVHLQNAMINILENAVKYSPEAPEIHVSLRQTTKQAVLRISDRGLGISKEDQKRIFEKFFRVSTGNVHTIKGYGLGLSYTQSVIERLGGSIDLESEPGKGSTFIIKLPLSHEG